MAAAGVPDVKERLLRGYQAGEKSFRVYLDGYNQLDHLTAGAENPRQEFFYFTDGGELAGIRQDRWKILPLEQRSEGLDVWFEPFDELRTPRIVDLRADPFERAMEESANYDTWLVQHTFVLYPVRDAIRGFLETFVRFPPRQPADAVRQLERLVDLLGQLRQ